MEASRTNRFLKESGALHYGEMAWSNFRSFSQQVYRWSQKNVPGYLDMVREVAIPYLRIAFDWLSYLAVKLWSNVKLLSGYLLEKKPLVEQWINQYAPGLIEAVKSWLWQAWTFLRDYTALFMYLLLKYLSLTGQWLMENVFVGSLSPESLQRYTLGALNTTQELAVQTIAWLSSKVETVSSAA